jgi:hypothetical protein
MMFSVDGRNDPLKRKVTHAAMMSFRTAALKARATFDIDLYNLCIVSEWRCKRWGRWAVDDQQWSLQSGSEMHQSGIIRDHLIGGGEQVDRVF